MLLCKLWYSGGFHKWWNAASHLLQCLMCNHGISHTKDMQHCFDEERMSSFQWAPGLEAIFHFDNHLSFLKQALLMLDSKLSFGKHQCISSPMHLLSNCDPPPYENWIVWMSISNWLQWQLHASRCLIHYSSLKTSCSQPLPHKASNTCHPISHKKTGSFRCPSINYYGEICKFQRNLLSIYTWNLPAKCSIQRFHSVWVWIPHGVFLSEILCDELLAIACDL